jgi:hypothetical protein
MNQTELCNLSQEEAEQVKECQRCQASLERGWSWHGKQVGEEYRVTLVQCFTCAEKERYAEYKQGKILTSRLQLDALYLKDAELSASFEKVTAKVKEFEQRVWFGGMQTTVTASQKSGMSYTAEMTHQGKPSPFTVMTFCSAARCMITMQLQDGTHVTVITEEKGRGARMGLQGICATEEKAIAILQSAMSLHKLGFVLKDDEKVGIL